MLTLIKQSSWKISERTENSTVFYEQLGDLNVNLLKYNNNNDSPINWFIDSLAPIFFIPYNLQPTWLTGHSKTPTYQQHFF